MSFHVHFSMSTGLSKPIKAPLGTVDKILAQIADVEQKLQLKTTQYRDNPPHWDAFQYRNFGHIADDKLLCETISHHNSWVHWLYGRFAEWSKKPPTPFEEITPEQARKFWHGLRQFTIPLNRWTEDYFKERMEHYYEVMRGRTNEGVSFDAKPLKPEQADAILILFSDVLDLHDCRATVPNGHDHVKYSDDGGYTWCEKCGAIDESDLDDKIANCRKRGGCPIREEYGRNE